MVFGVTEVGFIASGIATWCCHISLTTVLARTVGAMAISAAVLTMALRNRRRAQGGRPGASRDQNEIAVTTTAAKRENAMAAGAGARPRAVKPASAPIFCAMPMQAETRRSTFINPWIWHQPVDLVVERLGPGAGQRLLGRAEQIGRQRTGLLGAAGFRRAVRLRRGALRDGVHTSVKDNG